MKPLTCCMSAIVLLATSAFAYADAKSDAAARVKAVAPFVEAETAVVAHMDLARFDPPSWVDFVARIAPTPPTEVASLTERATKARQTAIQAGIKDIYMVVTLGNAGWAPKVYIAIPMPPDADAASIRTAMEIPAKAGRVIDGSLVFKAKDPTNSIGEFRPANRPELTAAFEAAGDSAVQVALIPPAYAPRVIEELLPQFPKELGGGPTTILTRGVSWVAAGIDLPPHPAVRLTIKSADAQAAETLCAKLAEMMRLAGECKQVRAVVPKFDELAAVLAPRVEGDRLVLVLNDQNHGAEKLLSLVTPPIEVARASAARVQSMNNLKMIALAMHNYAATFKHFPAPATYGKDGRPLLSWRVYVLPYIDMDLFRKFHLDEAWDSPHNRTLIDKMPSIYRMPMSKTEKGRTNYLLPVGGGAGFEADKPTYFKDIIDGTSNTIMTVEVDDDHAVIWTKPEDLQFDPKDPTKGLSRFFNRGFHAGLFDGSVRFFDWPKDAKQIETLRYLFQRADRHPVQPW